MQKYKKNIKNKNHQKLIVLEGFMENGLLLVEGKIEAGVSFEKAEAAIWNPIKKKLPKFTQNWWG